LALKARDGDQVHRDSCRHVRRGGRDRRDRAWSG
jgi:hypothetical protein